ncbi:hypothetical protein JCM8202v2_001500 [Rhodotorula sphaerocarpa]
MAKSSKSKAASPAKRAASPSASSSSSASPAPSPKRAAAADSDDSDSSRDSSASPEPVEPAAAAAAGNAFEQQRPVDPEALKYSPPEGYKAVKATAAANGIDWDEIKDDPDLELWTVRVPAGVKVKHLDGLTLTLPEGDLADPVQPIGHFTAKKAEYDVHLASAGASEAATAKNNNKRKRTDADEAGESAAGELQALVPLLPRKSQGNKLYQAPRPVSRTLTITRTMPASVVASTAVLLSHNDGHSTLIRSQPSPVPGAILSAEELLNPDLAAERKRQVRGDAERVQPSELLKERMGAFAGLGAQGGKGQFHNPMEPIVIVEREAPFDLGAVAADADEAAAAEEGEAGDIEVGTGADEEAAQAEEKQRKKEKKRSKAKEDGSSPKKKKKVKTEA